MRLSEAVRRSYLVRDAAAVKKAPRDLQRRDLLALAFSLSGAPACVRYSTLVGALPVGLRRRAVLGGLLEGERKRGYDDPEPIKPTDR